MSGQQPPRHGHGGWSTVPVPVPTGAQKSRGVVSAQTATPTQAVVPKDREVGVVRLRDEFLTSFPAPGIQQIARHDSVRYPPDSAIDDIITINSLTVPDGMVMVVTDVTFFATVAPAALNGADIRLTAASLSGLLRFSLLFGGRTPMQLDGSFYSPLGGTTRNLRVRSGWPFTERTFGAQRASAFAVYAKGGQEIDVRAVVDVVPDFPLTTVGAEMAGFTLSVLAFSKLFPEV